MFQKPTIDKVDYFPQQTVTVGPTPVVIKTQSAKLPETTFWQRVKYLFTKELPKQPVETLKGKRLYALGGSDPCSVSYTTFSGCDVKPYLVHGIGDNPIKEDLLRATSPAFQRTTKEATTKGQDYVREHSLCLAEMQAVTLNTGWAEDVQKSLGELFFILFNEGIISRLKDIKGPAHLVFIARDEYGNGSMMAIPNIKFTSYHWAISIDDLVSEERIGYEGDPPIHWTSIK